LVKEARRDGKIRKKKAVKPSFLGGKGGSDRKKEIPKNGPRSPQCGPHGGKGKKRFSRGKR